MDVAMGIRGKFVALDAYFSSPFLFLLFEESLEQRLFIPPLDLGRVEDSPSPSSSVAFDDFFDVVRSEEGVLEDFSEIRRESKTELGIISHVTALDIQEAFFAPETQTEKPYDAGLFSFLRSITSSRSHSKSVFAYRIQIGEAIWRLFDGRDFLVNQADQDALDEEHMRAMVRGSLGSDDEEAELAKLLEAYSVVSVEEIAEPGPQSSRSRKKAQFIPGPKRVDHRRSRAAVHDLEVTFRGLCVRVDRYSKPSLVEQHLALTLEDVVVLDNLATSSVRTLLCRQSPSDDHATTTLEPAWSQSFFDFEFTTVRPRPAAAEEQRVEVLSILWLPSIKSKSLGQTNPGSLGHATKHAPRLVELLRWVGRNVPKSLRLRYF